MPAVRGARLAGLLDGSYAQPPPMIAVKKADSTEEQVENPTYVQWIAQDQQVLSYLLSSLTKEILVQVSSLEHASEVWLAVTEMFHLRQSPTSYKSSLSSLGRRREINLCPLITLR